MGKALDAARVLSVMSERWLVSSAIRIGSDIWLCLVGLWSSLLGYCRRERETKQRDRERLSLELEREEGQGKAQACMQSGRAQRAQR